MHIAGLYAGIAALLVVVLGLRVSLARRARRIGIGHGEDRELERRVRAHANAIETIPLALILLVLLEWNQTQAWLLHVFGAVLIAARMLHAIGLSRSSGASAGRFAGIVLTWTDMGIMALLLVWQTLGTWILAAGT